MNQLSGTQRRRVPSCLQGGAKVQEAFYIFQVGLPQGHPRRGLHFGVGLCHRRCMQLQGHQRRGLHLT